MFLNIQTRWRSPSGEGSEALLSESLNQFAEQISDFTPLWRGIAPNILETSTAEQFSSQGAFGGDPWAPLSEETLRRRSRSHTPRRFMGKSTARTGSIDLGATILDDTGTMKESFRSGGEGHIEEYTPREFIWGSGITSRGFPYPVAHQYGTRRMPARPILVLTPEMISRIGVAGGAFLASRGRENGFLVRGETYTGERGVTPFDIGSVPFGPGEITPPGAELPAFE